VAKSQHTHHVPEPRQTQIPPTRAELPIFTDIPHALAVIGNLIATDLADVACRIPDASGKPMIQGKRRCWMIVLPSGENDHIGRQL
jgi:hypothetical protein